MKAGLFFAALGFAVSATAASAAALRISPVGFELAASQRAASLSVRDDGDAPMTVQVRVFRWSQHGGADVLEPTDALLASPPFASLEAGAEQTIRLIRADAPGAGTEEQAFRLLVDELPPATGEAGKAVRLLMRHSVPVFVEPSQAVRADVRWTVAPGAGPVRLAASNSGTRRLRIANLQVKDARGNVLAERPGLLGYVLAGAAMSFTLDRRPDAARDAAPARIEADTDLGRIDVALAAAS